MHLHSVVLTLQAEWQACAWALAEWQFWLAAYRCLLAVAVSNQ